ncbi:MAG: ribose-5-phosphate isomerase RpiA [Gemmatimonadales bacterium]|nr:MAG: ribose-5-phosphate isomerase RpiA [Gemmatimonadales bacterium]
MEAQKKEAGIAALAEVTSGMTLGLGTGSTVRHFLEALGAALRDGALRDIRGVPTSEDTATRARTLGIPLLELHDAGTLDLAVDGADEVAPSLDLIKGLGGALLREKMVVQASRRFVVIADASKRVERLGEKAPLPVEVVSFGWQAHLSYLESLGAEPRLRTRGLEPYRTDNGNFIVDLVFPGGIGDAAGLDRALASRAGVVETGLFLGLADRCYLATAAGVERMDVPDPGRPDSNGRNG